MAVITLAQYKTLMGITDTDATRDARITALITQIEQDICDYCNNDFTNPDVAFTGSMTINATTGFLCTAGGMDDAGFATGDTIYADGTIRQDGRFTIATIADAAIAVSETLVADTTSRDIVLSLVQWPTGLQLYAARMIAYQLDHMGSAGLASETIKSYSYSRQSGGGADSGYPAEILRGLDKWRYVNCGRGRNRDHLQENRGTWTGDSWE